MALEAILEPLDVPLRRACSGSEAVAIAENEDLLLVLLDLQMPELDGIETAARIKKVERSRSVPIIILTAGEPTRAEVAKGYASGAIDFIFKPIEPEVLRSKVSVFVDLFRKRVSDPPPEHPERISERLVAASDAQHRAEAAELELRADEMRLRLALESAGVGAWDFNPMTGALRWDARSKSLHGLSSREEISYETFLSAVHKDDREGVDLAVKRALDPGANKVFDVEYRALGVDDGVLRWIAARAQAIGHHGRTVRLIGTFLDVTARKETEHERALLLAREQAARAEAESASRAKDEFLATVSHELRNPLNAILGWSRVLLEEGDVLEPARFQRGLEVIARNAKAQVQLVEDILEVSRIVTGKLRLTTGPVDLRAVVDAAVETVRNAAQAKGVMLDARFDDGIGVVEADEDRVQQILWNLLTNAVKFTPAGGRVRIATARDGDAVRITVEDTGEGIEPSFLPHVFERFRQADGSMTRAHGGLGLGLAIVHHLVELHGGNVVAESDGLGKGSRFEVKLPLKASRKAAPSRTPPPHAGGAAPEPSAGSPLKGKHVLVLDDEEDMRDLIGMILEHAGARVRRVRTVEDALRAMAAQPPDIAVSDLSMPGEDGFDFVRRVRSAADARIRDTKLVAMTAYARAEDRHRVLEAGFDRHVAKPIEPAELVHVLGAMSEN